MEFRKLQSARRLLALLALLLVAQGQSQSWRVDLVTKGDSFRESATASGDSRALAITPDGQHVLFCSSATDLTSNNLAAPHNNLYVFCRTNGAIALVSADQTGSTGGNGDSAYASITPDGRYVVFESMASNLAPGDTNSARDIFVRDLVSGETVLVGVNAQGTGSGRVDSRTAVAADFYSPAISANGRHVAFISVAENLVTNDSNRAPDLFVRDVLQGVTTRMDLPGSLAFFGPPEIDPQGKFVLFAGRPGYPPRHIEIFVWDLRAHEVHTLTTGIPSNIFHESYAPQLAKNGHLAFLKSFASNLFCIHRVDLRSGESELVTTNVGGIAPGMSDSFGPEICRNGRFVAFINTNDNSVWLWDGLKSRKELVNGDASGQIPNSTFTSRIALSPEGQCVAFVSDVSGLVPGVSDGQRHLYIRDMKSDTIRVVGRSGTNVLVADDLYPVVGPQGQFVLFDSPSSGLAPDDLNNAYDVFLWDSLTEKVELISARHPQVRGASVAGHSGISGFSVSADGRYVAFESMAPDLVSRDTNGITDIILHDAQLCTNHVVRQPEQWFYMSGPSFGPVMTPDGRYVAFMSYRTYPWGPSQNLIEPHVFLYDSISRTSAPVSVTTNGTLVWLRGSACPSISANGQWVAFESKSADLAAGDKDLLSDVFLRDIAAGKSTLVSTNSPSSNASFLSPLISADGKFVVYCSSNPPGFFVQDFQTRATAQCSSNAPVAVAISADSRTLAWLDRTSSSAVLMIRDLVTRTQQTIIIGTAPGSTNRNGISVSHDGRKIAFCGKGPLTAKDNNNLDDVFVYDRVTKATSLLSANAAGTGAGNGRSFRPQISADGRYVAFRSSANDLIFGDSNGWDDLFVFDSNTGQRTLITSSLASGPANGMPLSFTMAADGKSIFFTSSASDLAADDHNGRLDVFVARKVGPSLSDSDLDGLDDAWEVDTFGSLAAEDVQDSDGDGISNSAECLAGTDPFDNRSVLRLYSTLEPGGLLQLRWMAQPGRRYRIQGASGFSAGQWRDVPGQVQILGQTGYLQHHLSSAPHMFYRLVCEPEQGSGHDGH